MRVSEAKSLIGKVVTLDLVNQSRITTKIEDVLVEDGTSRAFLKCKEALMFVRPNPQNPGQIAVVNYGYPDTGRMKDIVIPADAVIMVLPTEKALVDKFTELTSGIVMAPANTQLPPMEDIGAAMAKIAGNS